MLKLKDQDIFIISFNSSDLGFESFWLILPPWVRICGFAYFANPVLDPGSYNLSDPTDPDSDP